MYILCIMLDYNFTNITDCWSETSQLLRHQINQSARGGEAPPAEGVTR